MLKIGTFFAAILIGTSLAFAQSQPPSPGPGKEIGRQPQESPTQNQQQPTNAQRGTKEAPFFIQLLPPIQEQQKPSENASEKQSETAKNWGPSDYIAAITAAILLLQAIALGVTFLVIKDSARKQLRAYVGVPFGEIRFEKNERQLLAFVDYKNAGQTPAHRVKIWVRAKVVEGKFDNPDWLPAGDDTSPDLKKGGILLPSVTWRRHEVVSNVGTNFSELIVALGAESKYILVWGEFSYRDIFGKEWSGKFRFSSSTIQKLKKDGIRHYFSLIPDAEHTSATYDGAKRLFTS